MSMYRHWFEFLHTGAWYPGEHPKKDVAQNSSCLTNFNFGSRLDQTPVLSLFHLLTLLK